MDTVAALIGELYRRLTGDLEMQTIFGGPVRLYYVWAQTDAQLPYLVHRLENGPGEEWPLAEATYYLDLWDYSPNANRILSIRKRVVELLDWQCFSLPEAGAVRLERQFDGPIPEDTPQIWHHATQWRVRYYRTAEAAAVLQRG